MALGGRCESREMSFEFATGVSPEGAGCVDDIGWSGVRSNCSMRSSCTAFNQEDPMADNRYEMEGRLLREGRSFGVTINGEMEQRTCAKEGPEDLNVDSC